MIDLYCERCGPGLLAEPVNAITNVSFLIAALAAWLLARRRGSLSPDIWTLISLAVTIGIGSALFHTFATHWAQWLDILPILIFQLCFLWLYLRRVLKVGFKPSAVWLFLFLATAIACRTFFKEVLNGSLMYAPAFFVLIGLGINHLQRRRPERFILHGAALVFSISLFFRSIDEAICPSFPLGTHFLWHLFNGLLLYLCMRSLIVK